LWNDNTKYIYVCYKPVNSTNLKWQKKYLMSFIGLSPREKSLLVLHKSGSCCSINFSLLDSHFGRDLPYSAILFFHVGNNNKFNWLQKYKKWRWNNSNNNNNKTKTITTTTTTTITYYVHARKSCPIRCGNVFSFRFDNLTRQDVS